MLACVCVNVCLYEKQRDARSDFYLVLRGKSIQNRTYKYFFAFVNNIVTFLYDQYIEAIKKLNVICKIMLLIIIRYRMLLQIKMVVNFDCKTNDPKDVEGRADR